MSPTTERRQTIPSQQLEKRHRRRTMEGVPECGGDFTLQLLSLHSLCVCSFSLFFIFLFFFFSTVQPIITCSGVWGASRSSVFYTHGDRCVNPEEQSGASCSLCISVQNRGKGTACVWRLVGTSRSRSRAVSPARRQELGLSHGKEGGWVGR